MDIETHRDGLIDLYTNQLKDAGPFMTIVLNQAIHSLRSGSKPKRVENKVVKLEKIWRSAP